MRHSLNEHQMQMVLNEDNFNEAILAVQEIIGQNDGGNAGLYFSAYEEDSHCDPIDWRTPSLRRKMIEGYLKFERDMDEPDHFIEVYTGHKTQKQTAPMRITHMDEILEETRSMGLETVAIFKIYSL